jgi:cytoskeletal protein CcmA (bactofilin family)
MRKQLLVAGLIGVVVLPVIVGASGLLGGDRYILQRGESHSGNAYAVGKRVLIAGDVQGDLVSTGGEVIITGDVQDDVLVAGSEIQLSGTVGGDARLAGAEALVSGVIAGDLAVASGRLYAVRGSRIGGDLLIVGGDAQIEAEVLGSVRISGGEVAINGPVKGVVEVQGGRLVIGEQARLDGDLIYRGPDEPLIAPGAVILGETRYEEDDFGSRRFAHAASGFGVLIILAILLMSVFAAVLLFSLFKHRTGVLTHLALADMPMNAGYGILAVVVAVICSVLLSVSIIGLPVGIFGIMIIGVGTSIASALSGIVFGSWFTRVVLRKAEHQPTLTSVIWGTLALQCISAVPVFGWIVALFFCLVSTGVVARVAYHRFWVNRF